MSSCEFGCKLVFAADITVRCQSRHTPYSWTSKFVRLFDIMYCPNIGFLCVLRITQNTWSWCRVFFCEHLYCQHTRLCCSCATCVLLKHSVLVQSLVIISDLDCWMNSLKLNSSIIVVKSFVRYSVTTSWVSGSNWSELCWIFVVYSLINPLWCWPLDIHPRVISGMSFHLIASLSFS
jgi:hypothetical protein